MKRHFTVNAKSSIQAGPVDFDKLDQMRRPSKADIAEILKEHHAQLVAYAEAKFSAVGRQINADLTKISEKYIIDDSDEAHSDFVLDVLRDSMDYDSADSTILKGLSYVFDYDSDRIFTDVSLGLENTDPEMDEDIYIETPEVAFVIWLDDDDTLTLANMAISWPGGSFVDGALGVIFECRKYLEQVTLDNVIDVCEQIIYEYADFVDKAFSDFLERFVLEYFRRR